MYMLLYLKQIINKGLFCTVHGMLCDSLDGRGVWEGMDTNICMVESLHCSPETITTLLVIWLMHISRCCHPTISSSVVPFSSCLQSFQALGSVPMSQFFASGDQSIGVSASASLFPMNIQYWFSLGLTGFISLLSKGLPRVFSNTTVQKHQFFGAQLSLESSSHVHT